MSKIVRAANAMISNADKISEVKRGVGEYFFLYNSKYKWSISYNEVEKSYSLFYYPSSTSIETLAAMSLDDWQTDEEYIRYSSKDLNSKEAYETFSELYRIIEEKVFGVDKALDDIIKDDMSIF
jgi:hypothetical protein